MVGPLLFEILAGVVPQAAQQDRRSCLEELVLYLGAGGDVTRRRRLTTRRSNIDAR